MVLLWILGSGLVMSGLALVGSVTLLLPQERLQKLLLPLVALAAGTLLGGALFHLIPASVGETNSTISSYVWIAVGFCVFFALEQFLQWHHCHQVRCEHQPLTYLILVADGLHNLIGGLAVGGAFVIDVRLGIAAWIAAAAHEIPQELGDFAILVHGGWRTGSALLYNFLSALAFLVGGLLAYWSSRSIDVTFLLPFAAGNFIYIAAADLIPEVKHHESLARSILHFAAFLAGLLLLLLVRIAVE